MAFEWQYIASKSNPLVVRLGKLKDKKYRKEESLFRFDGIKLFCEAVQNNVELEYVDTRGTKAGVNYNGKIPKRKYFRASVNSS